MSMQLGIDRFLAGIEVNHGPQALLARYFLTAVQRVADKGVSIRFSSCDELLDINQRNLEHWFPLTTSFHPQYGNVNDSNCAVIIGENTAGDVVATQAVKLIDWTATNFKAEAESLRFFYTNPEQQKAPGERCFVTAEGADELSGLLGQTGAAWLRPDYRRSGVSEIINKTARAFAYTRWNIRETFSILTPAITKRDSGRRYGYSNVQPGVTMRNSPTSPDKDLNLCLGRISMEELTDEMFQFIMETLPQVDAAVRDRRAE